MIQQSSILFIDSDKKAVQELTDSLGLTANHHITHVTLLEELSDILIKKHPDIVFLDITFPDTKTGMQLLHKLKDSLDGVLIAVVPEDNSGLRSSVLDANPFFYISKPYNQAEISIAVKRAIEKINHSAQERGSSNESSDFSGIIGKSSQMLELFDLISRVADDDFSTVLIRGESGTGKELVAKAIHARSNRKSKNFVPVNCAAIPDDLLESELFGHTKGAFTGAAQNKQGRIQYADGGTLFLDEIGDMKPTLQAKLLRVLQEKEFEPVGGLQPIPVDTRILAATHCDLEQLVQEGQFREDLYYRLSVIPLNIPPLKSRKEDIPLLIEKFIKTYTTDRGRESFIFSPQAIDSLLKYNWKGNVRELENLIQHMSILYSGKTVDKNDLPEKYNLPENQTDEDISHISATQPDVESTVDANQLDLLENENISLDKEIDFKEVINDFETRLIINAMRASGGNKKEAARLLNLKRTTLLEKIKKKKLEPDNW